MKRIFLLVFVLILLPATLSLCVIGLVGLQVAYASPYTDVDVDTTYDMITNGSYPDLAVLDVRTKSEYDSGHIYGAVWIPHSELEARIDELAGYKDHEIIAYCLSGGRSATASDILDSYNFTKAYNMIGGISAWQSRGYPVWIATVHNVNTTFNYDTIQAAIDALQTLDGHTIFVDGGTYYEHVVLNKSLSLIGENRSTTIIDGNYAGNVIEIMASNVKITGVTVQNSYPNHPYCGIYIGKWTAGNNIGYNFITDNFYGIGLWNSSNNNSVYQNKIARNNFGVSLNTSSNNTISGNSITENLRGFLIKSCSDNNILCGNEITVNDFGVLLFGSSNNSVSGNEIIDNNYDGIQLSSSFNNTFSGNEITANEHYGVRLDSSCNNRFYHNNLDNTQQLRIDLPSFANFWDDGTEGNYWSDYHGADTDYDGIGESWYEIDENDTDHYPLMGRFSSFNTSLGKYVNVISNSTIEDLQYSQDNSTIKMYASNMTSNQTCGFCRVTIPHALMNVTNIEVIIDNGTTGILYHNYALYDDGTHRWIYFAYEHSTHEIYIIPEFPSLLILPLFIIATLLTVIVYKRKHQTRNKKRSLVLLFLSMNPIECL
jgi:parallel beta-helix repeat protein